MYCMYLCKIYFYKIFQTVVTNYNLHLHPKSVNFVHVRNTFTHTYKRANKRMYVYVSVCMPVCLRVFHLLTTRTEQQAPQFAFALAKSVSCCHGRQQSSESTENTKLQRRRRQRISPLHTHAQYIHVHAHTHTHTQI